jgi:hypothetical protein
MDGTSLHYLYCYEIKLKDISNLGCFPVCRYALEASLDVALSEQLQKRKLFIGQKLRVLFCFHLVVVEACADYMTQDVFRFGRYGGLLCVVGLGLCHFMRFACSFHLYWPQNDNHIINFSRDYFFSDIRLYQIDGPCEWQLSCKMG